MVTSNLISSFCRNLLGTSCTNVPQDCPSCGFHLDGVVTHLGDLNNSFPPSQGMEHIDMLRFALDNCLPTSLA